MGEWDTAPGTLIFNRVGVSRITRDLEFPRNAVYWSLPNSILTRRETMSEPQRPLPLHDPDPSADNKARTQKLAAAASAGLDAAGDWRRDGILFLVSAPSGTGKTTLCERIRREFNPAYSVSCTTRKPREGEVNGVHYHFISVTDFAEKVSRGEFLEHAEVHGHFYGTLRSEVVENLDAGLDVLMEIDTEGAAQIRHHSDGRVRRALVDTFIMPPSLPELRRRLRERDSESPEQIETRMLNAVTEMRSWREYQYTIVSASKEEDFDRFRSVYLSQRALTRRLIPPEGVR